MILENTSQLYWLKKKNLAAKLTLTINTSLIYWCLNGSEEVEGEEEVEEEEEAEEEVEERVCVCVCVLVLL